MTYRERIEGEIAGIMEVLIEIERKKESLDTCTKETEEI